MCRVRNPFPHLAYADGSRPASLRGLLEDQARGRRVSMLPPLCIQRGV